MRVLEHADVRDQQPAIVRRQRDAKRITPDLRVTDHGREIVRFDDPPLRIEPGLDFGDVDHMNLEAALVDDEEMAALDW